LACFLWTGHSFGAGIAAFKNQSFYSDTEAKPLVYVSTKDMPDGRVEFSLKNGQVVVLKKNQVAMLLEFPDQIPPSITNDLEMVPIRNLHNKILEFHKRFPQISKTIQSQTESVSAHVLEYESGKIRKNNAWLTKEEYKHQLSIEEISQKRNSKRKTWQSN